MCSVVEQGGKRRNRGRIGEEEVGEGGDKEKRWSDRRGRERARMEWKMEGREEQRGEKDEKGSQK